MYARSIIIAQDLMIKREESVHFDKKYLQERTQVDSQNKFQLSDARMLTAKGFGLILVVAVLVGCKPS